MSDPTREILDQIFNLPREQRALIAVEAAASLAAEDDSREADEAWAKEIARRVNKILDGTAETIPTEESLARARARVAEVRRRRQNEASPSA